METVENSPFRSLDLSASWPQVKDQFEHEAALDFSVLSVGCGSISEAHRNFLGVRCVPEAELNLGILNVSY